MLPVITISREYGSAGRIIGQKVAQQLSIPFYDTAILDQVTEQSGFAKEIVAEQGEYVKQHSKLWGSFNSFGGFYFDDPQNLIFKIQCQIIRELAAKGPCLLVGRCADYVLEGHCDTLNVFIHADYQYRAKRVLEDYKETPGDIRKYLKQRDRNRATYYKYYTDREWSDFRNYNLNLDSGYLGIDLCAELIVLAAKRRDTSPEPTLPPLK